MIREVNTLCDQNQLGKAQAEEVLDFLKQVNKVLGILQFEPLHEEIPSHIQKLFEERQAARKNKNWQLSDTLREKILEEGFVIEDTPSGAHLKRKLF